MERLTNAELEAIRQRAEAATQGATPEWYVDEDYKDTVRCAWSADLIAQSIPTEADATFIANARQDVPKLLAEVIRLRLLAHRLNVELHSAGETIVYEYPGNIKEELAKNEAYHEKVKKEINGVDENDSDKL